jgi:molybdate transport repressor ModE-like protein
MRHLQPAVAWHVEPDRGAVAAVDARLIVLLKGIDAHGSLVGAARAAEMPYRSAWAMLDACERVVGSPLALLSRGKGAVLTPFARHWLAAHDAAGALLASRIAPIAISASPAKAIDSRPRVLRVAARHDIALAQLKDRWRLAEQVALEFHGSAASLDAYVAGRVEIGGFHVALHAPRSSDPLLARVDPARDAVIRFLTREQGLVVPRGNPRRVRSLRDLSAKRLSIVNRQPGSGTRLLFDRLLVREGIPTSALAGYGNEEFTHAAVAATVAAGRAEAGFAIRAAAAQFGLGFVPVVTERYLFACARRDVESPRVAAFRGLLASRATRAVVAPLPGYALDAPGTLLALRSR